MNPKVFLEKSGRVSPENRGGIMKYDKKTGREDSGHTDSGHQDSESKNLDRKGLVRRQLNEGARVKQALADQSADRIVEMAGHVIACIRRGGKILFCGNGGSAADAQHLAAELVGRFGRGRPPLAAIALTTDTSVLTCLSNDYGFEDVFSKQVEAHGRGGDILVGISTSGTSKNILRAVKIARRQGLTTLVLVGSGGGSLARIADLALHVPHDNSQRIQEAHIAVGHIILDLLERELSDEDRS
jgi:D-sedoheptulose 7-phosphate isomerase